MYGYKYVPLETGGGFFSGGSEHRKIIDEWAAQGWRYAGFVPMQFTSHGGIS